MSLSGCSTFLFSKVINKQFLQIYQVLGNDKQIIRAVTSDDQCPFVVWDKSTQQQLLTRVNSATIPIRKLSDGIGSDFPVKTCEIIWPKGAVEASIQNQTLKPLQEEVNKIVILGDTGCRLKLTDNAFQSCNDLKQWPFKKIVDNALKTNPDLVVHVGDIHYRESPCPNNILGCKNSPWGYGFDTWNADFFDPAKPLLDAKPWVFVRGNHESCQRAGQGWHRFIDEQPWDDKKSCDLTEHDQFGNYSPPYAISLGKLAQIIIFDSSNIPSKDLKNEDAAFSIYTLQIRQSEKISMNKSFNIFANHHPISIVTPSKKDSENMSFSLNQNSLAAIMTQLNQQSLLDNSFTATLHGHIHVSEVIDYEFQRPVSLISGNSGSSLEFSDIKKMNLTSEQKLKMGVNNIHSYFNFGFATLERKDLIGLSWLFTEYDVDGLEIYSCLISNFNGKSTCADFKKN